MARARRKKAKPQGRPLLRLFESIVVIAVLGGLGYGVYAYAQSTEEFRVTAMHVRGLSWVPEQDIVAASELTTDHNLLFLSRSAVARKVEELPGIKYCHVEKLFPDTVIIEVEEREPVATVLVRNNLFAVDAEGVVIRREPTDGRHFGPMITEIPGLDFVEPGEALDTAPFLEALKVWYAFNTTAVSDELSISEIAALATNDIRMYCVDLPYELRWGRGNYGDQAKRLDILWQEAGDDLGCSVYLDLRFGEHVACL